MDSILQILQQLTVDLANLTLIGKSIGEFLEQARNLADDALLGVARERIEELDQAIASPSFDRGNWVIVKKDVPRTLETTLGPLHFERRYYRDKQTRAYRFLSDVVVGIEPYQRVEDYLMLGLVEAAAGISYRQASEQVCDGRISATAIMQGIRRITIPDVQEPEVKRQVEELHIQADEDHVHLQQSHRKSGQIRFAAIHEPKIKVGKDRYQLPERHILSSVNEAPEAFGERVLDTLDALYDLDQVKTIYCHGDGGSWIETIQELIPGSIPILDHFHLEKALLKVCRGDRKLRTRLRKCLNPWDDQKLQEELQMLVDSDVCDEEKARDLGVYLYNHQQAIINHFTLDHGGSCAEGLVSHVFSKRFSRDPLAWSVNSLRKLSHVRSHLENGGKLHPTMLRPAKPVDEKIAPVFEKMTQRWKSRKKTVVFDWTASIPGIGHTSNGLGAILKSITHGGHLC